LPVHDDENQLIRVTITNATKSEFRYDGKMRRRERIESVWAGNARITNLLVRYVYDGNLVVQERHYVPQPFGEILQKVVSYTRGNDLSGTFQGAGGIGGLLARTDHSTFNLEPSTSFYHADGNGNVTCLIDERNSVVARYIYDPYGNVTSSQGPLADANLYRFSSKELHEKSELVYYLYRYYEPNLQRWLNRDPLGNAYDITDAMEGRRTPRVIPWEKHEGPNLFQFVGNNPLWFIDSDGRGKLNIPKDERDLNWVIDCMILCDKLICKNAPYPAACLQACYGDCQNYDIPNLSCIFKGPKGPKPKITPK
jgi:RHS repeat-associated protein